MKQILVRSDEQEVHTKTPKFDEEIDRRKKEMQEWKGEVMAEKPLSAGSSSKTTSFLQQAASKAPSSSSSKPMSASSGTARSTSAATAQFANNTPSFSGGSSTPGRATTSMPSVPGC